MSEDLFQRLKDACAEEWRAYTQHAFVRGLGDGSLPEACFRHYLIQDYLFLIHFTRAYGLSVFKAESLDDMREAAATAQMLLDVEMRMHVRFCAGWGISEAQMAAAPEAVATMSYTRFVLAKGLQGDLLDLKAALAPCVVGYGEIGRELARAARPGNPYRAWIDMYAAADYQQVAAAAVRQLDRLGNERLTPARRPALEAAFWQMGLDLAS